MGTSARETVLEHGEPLKFVVSFIPTVGGGTEGFFVWKSHPFSLHPKKFILPPKTLKKKKDRIKQKFIREFDP